MSEHARALLAAHLKQRREMGEQVLFLETLTAPELISHARSTRVGAPAASARAVAAPSATEPARAGTAAARNAALAVLGNEVRSCTACRLHATRRSVVFGVGDPNAELVVVGEAPGHDEDVRGEPFVGRAGKLLDRLLLSAGFPRERVYICNVLKCRPPENRNPMSDEIETCSPYLREQIRLVQPRVILTVGKFAAQTLLSTEVSIGRLRGQIHRYEGVPVVASYHPAFLLRSPQWIRAAWQDFQLVRQQLDAAN